MNAEIEKINSNDITCDKCEGYLAGHATGGFDICQCEPVTQSRTYTLTKYIATLHHSLEQTQRELVEARTKLERALEVISNVKTGIQVITKGEYDFGEDFIGDESQHVAKQLLESLKALNQKPL